MHIEVASIKSKNYSAVSIISLAFNIVTDLGCKPIGVCTKQYNVILTETRY